jgi:hypothetical protein
MNLNVDLAAVQEHFADEFGQFSQARQPTALLALNQILADEIYGPVLSSFLKTLLYQNQEPVSTLSGDKDLELQAVAYMCAAARYSSELYRADHRNLVGSANFGSIFAHHHLRVRTGEIALLPEAYWTTAYQGLAQIQFADRYLGQASAELQRLLADVNYASFRPQTMMTGASMLQGGINGETLRSLVAWSETQTQESMPHLTASNIAIGQIVSSLFSDPRNPLIEAVDLGAGSGATSAAVMLGVLDAASNGTKNKLSGITSIDSSAHLIQDLREEMLPIAKARFQAGASINLVEDDLYNGVRSLNLENRGDSLKVFTANYVMHRLPSERKKALFQYIARSFSDVVILIADLRQNGSAVNRGYFNLRDNGLCNCGNIGLEGMLTEAGFELAILNSKTAPRGMSQSLVQKIENGLTSDSLFVIASKRS